MKSSSMINVFIILLCFPTLRLLDSHFAAAKTWKRKRLTPHRTQQCRGPEWWVVVASSYRIVRSARGGIKWISFKCLQYFREHS
uniref:Putative secreted protein n=1 Tax=Anopheles triannulatus TaxID=58253 RepID=A0A2M4B4W6_9DIPT